MNFDHANPHHNAGPPSSYAPVSRAEYRKLMKEVRAIYRRVLRTETRVTRLLEHHGLDTQGKPIVRT